MKIFVNQTSPYARKVRVVIREKGLDQQVGVVDVDPWSAPPELLAVSPLSRVPVLLVERDLVMTESDSICRYLDEQWPAVPLLPAESVARNDAISRVALVQGMIDCAFDAAMERRRPASLQWPELIVRHQDTIERGLAVVAAMHRPEARFDLGDIGLGCLLGYLDFRHPAVTWRKQWPGLARWFDPVSRRHSMAGTQPDVPVC
ncbi:MAG: glutathione S-transferase family protein [Betaproteobacteria bacterium]